MRFPTLYRADDGNTEFIVDLYGKHQLEHDAEESGFDLGGFGELEFVAQLTPSIASYRRLVEPGNGRMVSVTNPRVWQYMLIERGDIERPWGRRWYNIGHQYDYAPDMDDVEEAQSHAR